MASYSSSSKYFYDYEDTDDEVKKKVKKKDYGKASGVRAAIAKRIAPLRNEEDDDAPVKCDLCAMQAKHGSVTIEVDNGDELQIQPSKQPRRQSKRAGEYRTESNDRKSDYDDDDDGKAEKKFKGWKRNWQRRLKNLKHLRKASEELSKSDEETKTGEDKWKQRFDYFRTQLQKASKDWMENGGDDYDDEEWEDEKKRVGMRKQREREISRRSAKMW